MGGGIGLSESDLCIKGLFSVMCRMNSNVHNLAVTLVWDVLLLTTSRLEVQKTRLKHVGSLLEQKCIPCESREFSVTSRN